MTYSNVLDNSTDRDPKMLKIINNNSNDVGILFYLFVRERDINTTYVPKQITTSTNSKQNTTSSTKNTSNVKQGPPENYLDTLLKVYETFINITY